MDERALDNIVEDICSLLMKHVISREGKYHNDESQLSMHAIVPGANID